MKGLIRNNFYSMEGNIKVAMMMSAVLILAACFVTEPQILTMMISVQIFFFIVNVGTSLHADEVSKWNKIEITLPVDKNAVVKAKYITFFILILMGLTAGGLTGVAVFICQRTILFSSLLWGYQYGLTLALITTAIMYPCMLKFGTDKNELIIILSAILSVVIMLLVAIALIPFTIEMNLKSSLVGMVSAAAALLLLASSYRLSLRIYNKKEF